VSLASTSYFSEIIINLIKSVYHFSEMSSFHSEVFIFYQKKLKMMSFESFVLTVICVDDVEKRE
jgi:hypothetical protein